MLMTNGIGATIGTLSAQEVIDHFVFSKTNNADIISGWHTSWLIFAAYALVIAILFWMIFRDDDHKNKVSKQDMSSIEEESPEGMITPNPED